MNLLIPMLVCKNPQREIIFCKDSFNAIELSRREDDDGSVIHATLKIGNALFMVHNEMSSLESKAPESNGSSSVVIYLYGEEVDSVIQKAVAGGARILLPAGDKPWGDRVGRVIDPENHVWNIARRVSDE